MVLFEKPKFVNAYIYANFVYLDDAERQKIIKCTHEYLIEQVQFNQEIGISSSNIKQKLTLDHPCKSHYWVLQMDGLCGAGTINDLFNYTTSHIHYTEKYISTDTCKTTYREIFHGQSIVKSGKLVINGYDRFSNRSTEYFSNIEPYEHHSCSPVLGINVYSPSIYPEEHQPSSSINMSKIDTICMMLKLDTCVNPYATARLRSYTLNYGILRIAFGMGGMAFCVGSSS